MAISAKADRALWPVPPVSVTPRLGLLYAGASPPMGGVWQEAGRSVTASRVSIPMLTLTAVVILLAHDLFMAADAHGASSAHHHEHDAPVVDCHLPESVRPAAPDSADPAVDRQVPCALPGVDDARVLRRIDWEMPPRHPPDTLRALLQVFLN